MLPSAFALWSLVISGVRSVGTLRAPAALIHTLALLLHRSHSDVGLNLPDAPGPPLHPQIAFPRCTSLARGQMSA